MPLLWSLLALLFFYAVVFSTDQSNQQHILKEAEVAAVAENLMIYRNLVAVYAQNNPSAVGEINEVALALPNWYVKPPETANYLAPGTSYVYYAKALPGLVGELANKTESINVGINQSGYLNSPNTGTAVIPLPAQIPHAAVVIIQ